MLRNNGKYASRDILKEVHPCNAYESKKKSIFINRGLIFLNYDIFIQYNTLSLYLFTWKINTVILKRQVAKQYAYMILFLSKIKMHKQSHRIQFGRPYSTIPLPRRDHF